MVPRQTLVTLLFSSLPAFVYSSAVHGKCKDYKLTFERVYSVPGDVALLNCTLVSPEVFNYTTVPYNISWFDPRTGKELVNEMGRFLLRGETLWLLNVTLQDAGEYVCIVRTASGCFRQAIKLVVDQPVVGECGRPRKAMQKMDKGVVGLLSCPLTDYIRKLDTYLVHSSIRWYKGCTLIPDGGGRFTYWNVAKLKVEKVEFKDNGSYTCTLTFNLAGVAVSVSETIDAEVKEHYSLTPEVRTPTNESIKAEIGSSFSKLCRVFLPGMGKHFVDIEWLAEGGFISDDPSKPVYSESQLSQTVAGPRPGVLLELLLKFTEVQEEDFYINYTCRAYSSRGNPEAYFTLLPADPNLLLPIGVTMAFLLLLFISTTTFYFLFKVDIILAFRMAFPVLYRNTELDGKLFDAYVMYPRCAGNGNVDQSVETFALHALPHVLEQGCGYKLFIPGRDCLPGQAMVDSVEENMQASRRLILIYTASTFTDDGHDGGPETNKASDSVGNPGAKQSFECLLAMHRALLEGSLKVLLVEMEALGPDQLALLPESVRHLRRRQGVLCWWKGQRRWGRCEEEEEKAGQGAAHGTYSAESLSPSSSFWKTMRYHLPVRGKRAVYPEKMALLNW